MRTPPPVSALLEQDRLWQGACAALSGLAGVCLGVWLALHGAALFDPPSCTRLSASLAEDCALWTWVLPVLLGVVAGEAAWRPAGAQALVLGWTGNQWQAQLLEGTLSAGGAVPACNPLSISERVPASTVACEPALMIDLGHWMLLRLKFPSLAPGQAVRASWHALSASRMDPWSWHGLRIALHCARSTTAADAPGSAAVAAGARRRPGDPGSEP